MTRRAIQFRTKHFRCDSICLAVVVESFQTRDDGVRRANCAAGEQKNRRRGERFSDGCVLRHDRFEGGRFNDVERNKL